MAENLEELDQHIRACIGIFVGLLCLTLITVAVSYLDLSVPATISIALCIALVKGSMVVSFFMHLISEKKLIIWSLSLTVIFFFFLMVLPIATDQDITTLRLEVRY
jgi:caa(3)-type oxidase subunit IV